MGQNNQKNSGAVLLGGVPPSSLYSLLDKALNYTPPCHFLRGDYFINPTKHHIGSSVVSAMTGTIRSTWISFPPCPLIQRTLERLYNIVKIPLVSQHGCLSWQLADEFNLFLLLSLLKCLPNFKTKAN